MLSIIIPVFNQHEMTAECLQAIRENTQAEPFELIVVDNGSAPPFTPPFAGFTIIRVIRNEENLGFPKAVNQGIREAKGEIVVLLNNDVIVTPGWAERLMDALEEYAIVGPVTNYCAGLQKVTLPIYQDGQELNREALTWAAAHASRTQPVRFVIGFCMAFRRSLFDVLGPFDESLWPCSGEEIDFCLRARAAGYRIGIARDVYLHHFGSQTFQAMHAAGQLDYAETCRRNDAHLAEKWGADFWEQQGNP